MHIVGGPRLAPVPIDPRRAGSQIGKQLGDDGPSTNRDLSYGQNIARANQAQLEIEKIPIDDSDDPKKILQTGIKECEYFLKIDAFLPSEIKIHNITNEVVVPRDFNLKEVVETFKLDIKSMPEIKQGKSEETEPRLKLLNEFLVKKIIK